MTHHALRGLGTALITPFQADGNIDFPALQNLIAFVSEGSQYLVVNGTTGESATTSAAEQIELLSFVRDHNVKNLPIVLGIGGNNTSVVLDRIKSTDFSGVTALLSVCPYYNKPSQAGVIAHFQAIAEASPVPVLLYNVPGRTVTSMSAQTVAELAQHPNIIGLKDASCSVEEAMKLLKFCPSDFLLISGDDNLVTAQISLGYQGVISVIGNGFPVEFGQLVQDALADNFTQAAAMQLRFLDFDTLLYVESNPVGIKKVCEIKGLCRATVRLPLVEATEELGKKLKDSMIQEGFWS